MIRQIVSAAFVAALLAPAVAQAQDQPLARVELNADHAGEAKLALTASAPGADWQLAGKESAFLEVQVDGKPVTNVVTFNGPGPFTYEVALGRVSAGKHDITVTLDAAKSPVDEAVISKLEPSLAPADDIVARYAPILYGRNLPEVPGAFENVNTDVPILAYHTSAADAQGNRVIEYTVIWSNEDGGTNTPSLMARWGRTTDIEWFYRVTVDAQGNRITDAFQALNHGTEAFNGVREDDHPLIQVASSNNNMVAVTDVATSSGYRFFLETGDRLPDNRAREVMMDQNPWTYGLMAKEMVREGKVETVPDPDTQTMSDQRNYLFAELKKATSYATAPPAGSWAGVALAAKVGDRWYTSNKGVAGLSIERDLAAATTIELPVGTTPANISAIKAFAVPNGTPGAYSIDVTSINRGFKLGADFMPGVSFLNWKGKETLTPARTEVILWENENVVEAPVGGSVPATLSLTLGAPASFGAFTPGVEKTYTASTYADVVSTAGDASLAVGGLGHLTNGAFSLPEPLQVSLSKSSWAAPVSNDRVAIGFSQKINANDALRTGSYAKTLTFTLSTTTP
ncbi:hypothetical protein OJ997_16620 [Solirubrobacter phytolaccae]|uniref:Uncharacterized protein n=1 Tax=Solirubrobacter phytolaccae TaxID=1404360 RepID=A0A9X3NB89_9ACTN|nr:hypothetical protein [Solirubrobacter phytolaccae]MDA0181929.1 hypothetical protein [Solirubrobacter phytolaccae]